MARQSRISRTRTTTSTRTSSRLRNLGLIAIHYPGTWRYFAEFNKLPVTDIHVTKTEVIPNCRGDIKPGVLVKICFWTFIAKHILPVICAERPTIFPLRITNSVAVTDCEPVPLENRLTVMHKSILKPRNQIFSFRFGMSTLDIVIRENDVEWILT